MDWIIVKKVSMETDLSMVVGYLRERHIVHQVYEEAGAQVLAVKNPHIVDPLLKMLNSLEQGEIHFEATENPKLQQLNSSPPSFISQVQSANITSLLILFSILGACLVGFDVNSHFIRWFSFQDFTVTEFHQLYFLSVSDSLHNGQIWRLITPAFLHFGFFHVLFNSMWMWDLGRRLEFLLGKKMYLLFFIVTATVSNVVQYWWASSSLFGGMSGFVYALVGFILVSHRLLPHPLTAVAPGVLWFMLIWLVICGAGVIDPFIGGGVANAAHVGGLLAGAAFAFVIVSFIKATKKI